MASTLNLDIWAHIKRSIASRSEDHILTKRSPPSLEQASKPQYITVQPSNHKRIMWPVVEHPVKIPHVGATQDEVDLLLYFSQSVVQLPLQVTKFASSKYVAQVCIRSDVTVSASKFSSSSLKSKFDKTKHSHLAVIEEEEEEGVEKDAAELLLFFARSLHIQEPVSQAVTFISSCDQSSVVQVDTQVGMAELELDTCLPVSSTACRTSKCMTRPRSQASKDVQRRLSRSALKTWRNKSMSDQEWDEAIEDMEEELANFMIDLKVADVTYSLLPSASTYEIPLPNLLDSSRILPSYNLSAHVSTRRTSKRIIRPRSQASKDVQRRLSRSALKTWRNKSMSDQEWDEAI